MLLFGSISSYDPQRRSGYIKEKEGGKIYFFAKVSVLDPALKLEVGRSVKFDLFTREGNDAVAVRIYSTEPKNIAAKSQSNDHIDAVVIWFSIEKKYGFVRCNKEPKVDAFLHLSELKKIGLERVIEGQALSVCLEQQPGKKSFNAVNIIIPSRKSQKHFEILNSCRSGQNNSHNSLHSNLSNENSEVAVKHDNDLSLSINTGFSQMAISARATLNPEKKKVQSSLLHHFSPSSKMVTNRVGKNENIFYSQQHRELQEAIESKQRLLRTLDLKKLPDGGHRIKEQISQLESKLQNLKITKPPAVKKLENVDAKPDVFDRQAYRNQSSSNDVIDLTSSREYDYSLYNKNNEPQFPNTGEFYGGRMTNKRINLVRNATSEAIEKLHLSLDTCPSHEKESTDPSGLLVTLMQHQKQALTWLVWREGQAVSGGILADDMGLGKTLTMIALILKQTPKEQEENNEKENGERVKNENCETDNKENIVKINPSICKDSDSETKTGNKENKTNLKSQATLIVAPASLIFHWESEIRNRCESKLLDVILYHGTSREKDPRILSQHDVVITTYDLVRRCYSKFKVADTTEKPKKGPVEDVLFRIHWRRIILDEAHQIRNFKSQTSTAVCVLEAQSRWAMSGTPVQNEEMDMYSMIKFLHCHPFDEYQLWKHQVSNKTERGQQRMKTLVSCLVLRREKNQKGKDGKPLVPLPPRNFSTHKLKLSQVEKEVYDKLKHDSQTAYKNYEKWKREKERDPYNKTPCPENKKMTATTLIVMLLRLRQCCGHLNLLKNSFDPELLEKEKQDIAVEDLLQSLSIGDGQSKDSSLAGINDKDKKKHFEISAPSSKIKFVMDMLQKMHSKNPSDKCVIISQWTSMLRVLAYHLDQENYSYATIEGGVSAQKRMELVDRFNKSPKHIKVMLVSLQAGGVGLNLIGGNHLFLLDMHWNPALERQAFDRIYRVGQKKEVFVHKFVMEDTVEESILQLQERKLAIAKAVLEGATSENKVKLTLADMKILFGIH